MRPEEESIFFVSIRFCSWFGDPPGEVVDSGLAALEVGTDNCSRKVGSRDGASDGVIVVGNGVVLAVVRSVTRVVCDGDGFAEGVELALTKGVEVGTVEGKADDCSTFSSAILIPTTFPATPLSLVVTNTMVPVVSRASSPCMESSWINRLPTCQICVRSPALAIVNEPA